MSADPIKIAVMGASGRMGRMNLAAAMDGGPGVVLCGACDRPGAAAVGQDAGRLIGREAAGVAVGDDPAPVVAGADAVIDFTTPQATVEHARLCAQAGAALIVGTTGLGAADEEALTRAARHVAVVHAANMSAGVTLLRALVERVARALDADFDIEVVEMHHRHKVDAPSGTALALGRAAAKGRGVDHDAVKDAGRDGHTGARRAGDIGYAVLRGGDVVGEHTVVFAGPGERIELTHKAADRAIFAAGALRAARWAAAARPGLYSMEDVLGLSAA